MENKASPSGKYFILLIDVATRVPGFQGQGFKGMLEWSFSLGSSNP
jgi:hypothetical protein